VTVVGMQRRNLDLALGAHGRSLLKLNPEEGEDAAPRQKKQSM
jgi:hypothetical protein